MLYPVFKLMFVIEFFWYITLDLLKKKELLFSSLSICAKRDPIQTPRARSSSILSNSFFSSLYRFNSPGHATPSQILSSRCSYSLIILFIFLGPFPLWCQSIAIVNSSLTMFCSNIQITFWGQYNNTHNNAQQLKHIQQRTRSHKMQ